MRGGILMERICKGLVPVAVILFMLGGCGGGKEEAPGEGLKEWDGAHADSEMRINELKAQLYEAPDNLQLLSALGDLYFEAQRYDEAIKEYEKALKIDPANADCLNDMALALFYTGDVEAAVEASDKATKAGPAYKHAWLSRGFILMSIGKNDEAIISLNRVKELDPGGRLAIEADNFLSQINAMSAEGEG